MRPNGEESPAERNRRIFFDLLRDLDELLVADESSKKSALALTIRLKIIEFLRIILDQAGERRRLDLTELEIARLRKSGDLTRETLSRVRAYVLSFLQESK